MEMLTVPKEKYDYLVKQSNFLDCLEASGVDNWSGYGEARQMEQEEEE